MDVIKFLMISQNLGKILNDIVKNYIFVQNMENILKIIQISTSISLFLLQRNNSSMITVAFFIKWTIRYLCLHTGVKPNVCTSPGF